MRRFVTFTLLALAVGLGGVPAPAKPLARILQKSGLSPADFAFLGAAERSLYETATPRPGRVVSWTNPETRSHGTVRLAALRGNCAYLRHFVYPRGETKAFELRNRMCRAADGKWLLTP